ILIDGGKHNGAASGPPGPCRISVMNPKSRFWHQNLKRKNHVHTRLAKIQLAMREPFNGPQTFTQATTLRNRWGASGEPRASLTSDPPLLSETKSICS